jgi:hypothetical protein
MSERRDGLVLALFALVLAFVGWAALGAVGILLGLAVPLALYAVLRWRRDR